MKFIQKINKFQEGFVVHKVFSSNYFVHYMWQMWYKFILIYIHKSKILNVLLSVCVMDIWNVIHINYLFEKKNLLSFSVSYIKKM